MLHKTKLFEVWGTIHVKLDKNTSRIYHIIKQMHRRRVTFDILIKYKFVLHFRFSDVNKHLSPLLILYEILNLAFPGPMT